MKLLLLLISVLFFLFTSNPSVFGQRTTQRTTQTITQTIRGKIVDKESKYPLIGANVVLLGDTQTFNGATADIDGYYRLENVGVGKQQLKISFIGYETVVLSNIIVESAKETILNIELEESAINISEFEVTATEERGAALNEMALISSKAFSIEETDRYAGSRGDPARMAANFAGVSGSNDSRNDIIVRGNSPMGVLWRFEGVDIPNPNHFAATGTQGGPTSIINNKYLANSDFFTGAFPAEYGNSLAGVFDLKMRNGNNEKHERTFQFGILGTEIMAEGPLSKKNRSSYIVNYRYSTVTLFNKLGIDIGTSSKLYYQDAAFKFNFPLKKGGNLSLFSIGGNSDVDIVVSEQKVADREIYGLQDRDQYFGTGMAVVGGAYTKSLNKNTYLKLVLAQSIENQRSYHQLIHYNKTYQPDSTFAYTLTDDGYYKTDSLSDYQRFNFNQGKTSLAFFINKKIKVKHVIKAGIRLNNYYFNFQDSLKIQGTNQWLKRWDSKETALMIEPYVQWKWKLNEKLVFTAGIHSQYYTLNNSYSLLEPRAGLKWKIDQKQALSLGYGKHSQTPPAYILLYQIPDGNGGFVQPNKNTEMTKNNHYVLGYNRSLGKSIQIKTEIYYQYLTNVAVETQPSSFSLMNQGVGFQRFYPDSLKNTGKGENYGAELTIQKFFNKQFFFMITGAYYESFYWGSDNVKRNTDFNGNYTLNVLGSKAFKIKATNLFVIGAKVTTAGGKRYGPVDIEASKATGDIVYIDEFRNSKQFAPYFRFDIKLNYKINRIKVSHEIAIDLVNMLGNKNILKLSYAPNLENPSEDPIQVEYQLGFLPIFYYRLNF